MLFHNPRSVIYLIAAFLLLLLAAFATRCRSAEMAFEAGRAILHGEAPSIAFSLSFANEGRQDFNYECGLVLNGSYDRGPNNFGAQCLAVDGFRRFDLGLGLVYLQNVDVLNGSHLNFSLLARYRFTDRWSLTYRHWSNAGSTQINVGRDMLLISMRLN